MGQADPSVMLASSGEREVVRRSRTRSGSKTRYAPRSLEICQSQHGSFPLGIRTLHIFANESEIVSPDCKPVGNKRCKAWCAMLWGMSVSTILTINHITPAGHAMKTPAYLPRYARDPSFSCVDAQSLSSVSTDEVVGAP